MYDVPIKELEFDGREYIERNLTNFHNIGVECSTTHHGLVGHGTSLENVHVFNLFQWILLAIMDVKKKVIGNPKRQPDTRIKVVRKNCKIY